MVAGERVVDHVWAEVRGVDVVDQHLRERYQHHAVVGGGASGEEAVEDAAELVALLEQAREPATRHVQRAPAPIAGYCEVGAAEDGAERLADERDRAGGEIGHAVAAGRRHVEARERTLEEAHELDLVGDRLQERVAGLRRRSNAK